MSQASPDGSLVADLDIANLSRAFGQQRANLAQPIRSLELIVSCHRANANLSALFANVGQVLDPAEINEDLRRRQSKLHRGNQAVPAREYFCIIGMLSEKSNSF